jgi:hypothetical protein
MPRKWLLLQGQFAEFGGHVLVCSMFWSGCTVISMGAGRGTSQAYAYAPRFLYKTKLKKWGNIKVIFKCGAICISLQRLKSIGWSVKVFLNDLNTSL